MTDADILFRVVYNGDPVVVTHAEDTGIELFAGEVGPARDVLELWSLIAIRCGSAFDIHALGWRLLLENTWITSPLLAVDLTAGAVRTRSGHTYLLGGRDKSELDPELRAHLAYALRTWGFDDVRP
jgi:hypothetical protein